MKQLILGWILVSFLFTKIKSDTLPTVSTQDGSLQGKQMQTRGGKEFVAFLGIPYSAPPTDSLRFKPPTPPQKWEGTRKATQEESACIQRDIIGKEDCLYLNVFTHHPSKDNLTTVMVYIHGGGFYGGSSALGMYGPEYMMERDIVLVTLQYRLGVFGFLSTEDEVIPGNMGLKDQVWALQWVQENIDVFGGDKLKVTIFGNSAGSASVHLHMISPASKNLFSKAISQSGTALSAFAMIGDGTSRNITLNLAKRLNCSTESSEKILQCFLSKSSENIQQEYSKLQDENYEIKKVLFRPIIEEQAENAFLTSSPLKSTTNKPWLVGLNRNEGLFKINLTVLDETIAIIKTDFVSFIPSISFFDDTCSIPSNPAVQIYNKYFKNVSSNNGFIRALEHVISYSWFILPTLQSIQQHNGTLYCYLFEHAGEHSVTQVRNGPQGLGVSHMDELHYLFSRKQIFPSTMNEKDKNISKLLVNLWVNFAEETNPTSLPINKDPQRSRSETITWEPSTNNSEPRFLRIETNKLSMVSNVFSEELHFWKYLPIRDKLVQR